MRLASSLVLLITLAACGGDGTEPAAPVNDDAADTLLVYTVNYPLAYLAEHLGGDEVEVVFPAPPGEDPAIWSPNAEAIAAYQTADLIVLNGAGYAKWIERATLPDSKLVDTTVGVTDRLVELTGAVTHSHGPEGEHEHQGWAFTTWLDPTLAMEQAQAIATAFRTRLPAHEIEIDHRLADLEADLMALDDRLAAAATAIGDQPLLFSHPVYQYLIHRYGLNGHQIHWEPDVAPDGAAWSELSHILDHNPARWMLWEGIPMDATVAALDERGISSVVFSPCANHPEEGDWMTVMTENANVLETIAATVSD